MKISTKATNTSTNAEVEARTARTIQLENYELKTCELRSFDYAEEKSSKKHQIYSKGFQAMLDGLDEEDSIEEGGQATEKKRRLSMHQVKALEKNFDVGNKLEPERKVKLAEELGLQPRQVAIWFQNRRARWKTKMLEKDYAMLKANREKEPLWKSFS
ncbi:hypothetical protein V6Z11_D12G260200 [Gossypium hirsutum]